MAQSDLGPRHHQSQLELPGTTAWPPVTVKTIALQDRPGDRGDRVRIRSDTVSLRIISLDTKLVLDI